MKISLFSKKTNTIFGLPTLMFSLFHGASSYTYKEILFVCFPRDTTLHNTNYVFTSI